MEEIKYLQKTVSYTDTSSFLIGYLPPNSYVVRVSLLVTTAFDTGSVIDIGDASTANKFANDIAPTSTGSASVTSTAQWGVIQSTTDQTQIKGIVVAGGSTLVAGSAKIVVEYAFGDR